LKISVELITISANTGAPLDVQAHYHTGHRCELVITYTIIMKSITRVSTISSTSAVWDTDLEVTIVEAVPMKHYTVASQNKSYSHTKHKTPSRQNMRKKIQPRSHGSFTHKTST